MGSKAPQPLPQWAKGDGRKQPVSPPPPKPKPKTTKICIEVTR